ncbi:helix-turn-helix domain-containing protein [bacterium]|nr:helix-turn-helix domain-containing protein [bacterium]
MQRTDRRPGPAASVPTHFEPVFDDRYDEITKPNVELRVPAYFMKHWSPRLSAPAVLLYLQLRLMCWYDEKNPKNTRDYCWPKQATLAKLINSGERSVRRYLKELEANGLIRRGRTGYYDKDKGKKLRGVDVYYVPYRVPVTSEDSAKAAALDTADILAARAEHPENRVDGADSPTGQIGRLVRREQPAGQIGQGTARPDRPTEVVLEVSKNVRNVARTESKGLASHPVIRAMTPEERAARKRFAHAIGEQLTAMNAKLTRRRGARSAEVGLAPISDLLQPGRGRGEADQHKDYGFHWLVAHFMPGPAVASALVATEDAVEDEIQGNRTLATTPDRYFTGVIRRICATEAIELPGVRWNAP